jgi:pentose-5-phosphate-3-epimerase
LARFARPLIFKVSPIFFPAEIDGGVTVDNIAKIAEAGVDMFVAGSAILKAPRTKEAYAETIKKMRANLAASKATSPFAQVGKK